MEADNAAISAHLFLYLLPTFSSSHKPHNIFKNGKNHLNQSNQSNPE